MSDPTGAKANTPLALLRLTQDYFAGKGLPSPRVDAEILLAFVLKVKRLDLYLRFDQPLNDEEIARFRELVRKRGQGHPVQHLTGEQEFFALKLQVTDKVLVPRPETEGLVEAVFLKLAKEGDTRPWRVCEVGTGSGAIAITLAKAWPQASIKAIDLSLSALDVARENVRFHELSKRLELLHGDGLNPVLEEGPSFDLIISNPPYVTHAELEALPQDVRDFEPRLALDGGPDGLDLIRRLIRQAPALLVPGGRLFLEIGETQGPAVLELLREAGFGSCELRPDLAGRPRVICGQKASI